MKVSLGPRQKVLIGRIVGQLIFAVFCLAAVLIWFPPQSSQVPVPAGGSPVSYTHLTLPTNREV